jgi:hypothetical protein
VTSQRQRHPTQGVVFTPADVGHRAVVVAAAEALSRAEADLFSQGACRHPVRRASSDAILELIVQWALQPPCCDWQMEEQASVAADLLQK